MEPNKRRVRFYIDGFNFYYGIKRSVAADRRWGNAYWIDVVKLCSGFIGPDEILDKVFYFTASPLDSGQSSRQSAFLNANKEINKDVFEVVRGKYLAKQIECPNCRFSISRPEEKKTDVNISVRMIADCMEKSTDKVVLISADTDLIPPLELIRSSFSEIKIKVMFPPSNFSHDLSTTMAAWKSKVTLMERNLVRFEESVMPDTVAEGKYSIPPEWKRKQVPPIAT